MIAMFLSLLQWMPTPLFLLCSAVVCLFFFFTLLHLVKFILDLFPFT